MSEDASGEGGRRPDSREISRASGGGSPIALGPGVEFDLIRAFFARGRGGRSAGVRLGAGDDAAIVEGDGIVLSTDLSIEEVHFRRAWLEPRAIGYRAAVASLSDLAAMAARPIGVLASVAVPPGDARTLAIEVMSGITDAVIAVGGELLGGDLARSPGPLILDLVSVGTTATPVLRSGAIPGDELWVTGELGAAAFAVSEWQASRRPPPEIFERFGAPVPRIAESLWLAERGVPEAMLDLSDGLGKDAGHLAAAGGLAVVIDPSAIPVHPVVASAAPGRAGGVRLALSGGEDYELCFAARPGTVERHLPEFQRQFRLSLSRVGRFEAGEGVVIQTGEGHTIRFRAEGFHHFGGPS